MRLSWHQAKAPAPVETPQEEMREPVSDNDSEQYPDDDIPEEDEEDDEEDEDDDPDEADYKVNPLNFSVKLMLDDDSQVYLNESLYVCLICRALLQKRQKRRMRMMRGLCHPTMKKHRTSLMVSVCVCVCVQDRVTQQILSYE